MNSADHIARSDAQIEKLRRLIERPGTPGEGQAARAALDRIITKLPIIGRPFEHLHPCGYCGSKSFIVEPGKGPHAFHLRCVGCRRGGRWIPHAEAERLKDEHAAAIAGERQ